VGAGELKQRRFYEQARRSRTKKPSLSLARPACLKREVVPQVIAYTTEVKHDGLVHTDLAAV